MTKWRPTRFLILEQDNEYMDPDEFSADVMAKISYCSDPYMLMIECHHPKFEDNVVILKNKDGHEYEFVRDVSGNLYGFDQFLTKEDIINQFEPSTPVQPPISKTD